MIHQLYFEAEYVSIARGGGIRGGHLSGHVNFECDASPAEVVKWSAKKLGAIVIKTIAEIQKHKNKKLTKIGVNYDTAAQTL